MQRKLIFGIVAVVASLAVWFGLTYLFHGRFIEHTDDAYVKADTAVIAPRINGYVSKVLVRDNQQVHTGDILATLADDDLRAALDQAKAVAMSRRAVLDGMAPSLAQQKQVIEAKAAALDSATAQQKLAAANLQRARDLRTNGSGSKQAYDAAVAAAAKADADVQSAEAALAAERSRLVVLDSTRQQTEADAKAAEAAERQAELNLSYANIRAPFDGVVGARTVQDGQYVRTGAQMMSVVRLPDVFIVANFKETQAAQMRRGQKVKVAIDAFPDLEMTGTVDSFSPATGSEFSLLPPENATGNFTKVVQRIPVKIVFDPAAEADAMKRLRPGMSVSVSIDIRDEGEGAQAALAPAPRPVEAAVQ